MIGIHWLLLAFVVIPPVSVDLGSCILRGAIRICRGVIGIGGGPVGKRPRGLRVIRHLPDEPAEGIDVAVIFPIGAAVPPRIPARRQAIGRLRFRQIGRRERRVAVMRRRRAPGKRRRARQPCGGKQDRGQEDTARAAFRHPVLLRCLGGIGGPPYAGKIAGRLTSVNISIHFSHSRAGAATG